ncbi:MAG TPA: GNAT family N-acetyltransferase [Ktedonobacterales bacterium]|jgi:ribosomal protein S18 acetylase RimI-like enzyme
MVVIRPLSDIDAALLERLITGYTSSEMYRVTRVETLDMIRFELQLIALEQPFVKRYPLLDATELQRYRDLAAAGHTFGAFKGEMCVGIALCEPQRWNSSLYVWEFHIASEFQRQGAGRALMAAVEAHARDERLRCVVCETQTTNVPAIRFYRALGFTVDAVDISLYTNDDIERGEVAVFMKKRISHAPSDDASILHRDE